MRIYTSYYGNKAIPKHLIQISISKTQPEGYRGKVYQLLIPTWDLVGKYKADHDMKAYIIEYTKSVLRLLKTERVIEDLRTLGNGADVVLLCYERPTNFCHRQIVAEWLSDKTHKVKEI